MDAVVTDKKGAYISDLKAKDFRVSEDGKEQIIKSFTFEADPASGAPERTHYLVLMFDNASMSTSDQQLARQAAGKFIDSNAGPNKMMAVVNFGGEMKVAQNFTSDPARLKAIVSGVQFPAVASNNSSGTRTLATDFAARDMLQSLRSVAKGLSSTQGRKILILFTAGFALTAEQQSEVTATIAECNRDNVAIYPLDVRGLSTAGTAVPRALLHNLPRPPSIGSPVQGSVFESVAFMPGLPFAPQARGGAAPSSAPSAPAGRSSSPAPSAAPTTSTPSPGSRTAPATSTTTPGNTTPNSRGQVPVNGGIPGGACAGGMNTPGGAGAPMTGMPGSVNPCNANRVLVPKFPPTATTNQQVMFMLASGTGGFVIHDDNDLVSGLQKIGQEQNQYYILGYTPPDSKDGACHVLKVKVDRGGTEVRARPGYCSAKPLDVLSGTPVLKGLEAKMAEAQPGKVMAGMRLPFFYTSPNVARVNLAMEIATDALKFEKKKGILHAEVNFLGIAYTPQGTVAARFSDTLNLDYTDKEDADAAKRLPLHYENQFDIASGKYTVKVVYSEGGDNFGKLEAPLDIDPYSSDALAISGVALSKQYHRASEMGAMLDVAVMEDKTPLIADGLQIVPTGNTAFGKSDLALFYIELYEPLLVSADPKSPPTVNIRMRVLDRKTGEQKLDTNFLALEPAPPPGNLVVRLGGRMPISGLPAGAYKIEFTVADSADKSAQRTADFDIQ